MKKVLLISFLAMSCMVTGCSNNSKKNETTTQATTQTTTPAATEVGESELNNNMATDSDYIAKDVETPEEAKARLIEGNNYFMQADKNPAKIPMSRVQETYEHGQNPFAVIVTCSDSRVAPEHVFSEGVADLFVIRTAGNVVNEFEIGSVEYGVAALGAKTIVVMGHTNCGAVSAAIGGTADGNIQSIVDEIRKGIDVNSDLGTAENSNITHTRDKLMESDIIKGMVDDKSITILQAKYDIETGKVTFFEE